MYNVLMTKFTNGHADIKGVYFDEENRRHLLSIRQSFADLAKDLIAKNRMEDARKVIRKIDSLVPEINVPYGIPSRYELHNQASYILLEAAYGCDEKEVAAKISKSLTTDMNQQMEYYASLGDNTSRKQLEEILMRYNQMRFSSQSNEQRNQAEGFFISSLSNNQTGLAAEIARTFDFLQYIKQTESKYLPQPAAVEDSLKPVVDSTALNPDTLKPN